MLLESLKWGGGSYLLEGGSRKGGFGRIPDPLVTGLGGGDAEEGWELSGATDSWRDSGP